MGDEFKAPYISFENLREQAEAFLKEFHPQRNFPIPIEEIVDLKMGINVVPMPGLRQLIEVEGFTTSNLQDIYVDEYVYENIPNRYRFTLAHEVGHIRLHGEIYSARNFDSIEGWKEFINSIPEDQHGWMESHAYHFAGFILVPTDLLLVEVDSAVDQVLNSGLNIHELGEIAWTRISAFLAGRFEVSTGVIERRIDREGIKESFS